MTDAPAPATAPSRPPPPHPALAVALDLVLIWAAVHATTWLRSASIFAAWLAWSGAPPSGWSQQMWPLTLFQSITIAPALQVLGQYRLIRDPGAAWSFNRVLLGAAASFGALFALLFSLDVDQVPRAEVVVDFLVLVLLLAGWRMAWTWWRHDRSARGVGRRNVLLVGHDRMTQTARQIILQNPLHGRRLVGTLLEPGPMVAGAVDVATATARMARDRPEHTDDVIQATVHEDVERALDGLGVEEVMLAPSLSEPMLRETLKACQARGIDTHIIPGHQDLGVTPRAWTLGSLTLFDVHRIPISRLGWMIKRGMDIGGSLVGLLLFAPVMLVTAVAIKIEAPRQPVLYPGDRVGLKGRPFRMAKFTTMRPDAQDLEREMMDQNTRDGPWFKLDADSDPRLTRVGRFIRKYSINEIPQFWNVLKGDMSLVGPRPPLPGEVATYVDYDFRYFRCLDVRPGITGLWQVTCKNDPSFDRRIELDLEYIHDWSPWLDLKILIRTLWTVVREPES